MEIPFEPIVFGTPINVHFVLEYLAFFIGFRYYVLLRRSSKDVISTGNRLSIILGAVFGALIGSRVMGFLEYPYFDGTQHTLLQLFNMKTIMGGLFGGLLGVEIAKRIIGEKTSSGDLFTLPIIVGIFIGRIGCFLAGTQEFTYGKVTTLPIGMDAGDGLLRHPIVLYELLFLVLLFFWLKHLWKQKMHPQGTIFKYFMIAYFGFRFGIEFLKPNEFYLLGLSSIQYLCIGCFIYYRKTIVSLFRKPSYAR